MKIIKTRYSIELRDMDFYLSPKAWEEVKVINMVKKFSIVLKYLQRCNKNCFKKSNSKSRSSNW